MNSVWENYVLFKKEFKGKFIESNWGGYLCLGNRLEFVSHKLLSEIRAAHVRICWTTNPRDMWKRLMDGNRVPTTAETLMFCEKLNCTIEEFCDPTFSFADREAELRREREVETVKNTYGLKLNEAA